MKSVILLSIVSICYCQNYEPETITKRWPGPFANHKLGENVKDTPEVLQAKERFNNFYRAVLATVPELPPEERYIGPAQEHYKPHSVASVSQFQPEPSTGTWSKPQPSFSEYRPNVGVSSKLQSQYQNAPTIVEHRDWNQEIEAHQNQPFPKIVRTLVPTEPATKPPVVYTYSTQFVPPYVPAISPIASVPVHSGDIYAGEVPYRPNVQAHPERAVYAEDVPRSPYGETPEVAAARQAHLEAVARATHFLPPFYS